MIKIIAGKYGPKLLGPGTVLNLDKATEERLVNGKVAAYIKKENEVNETGENENPNVENEDNETDENEDSKVEIKSMEQLQKIRSKKELIQYAESVGLHELIESDSKEVLVDSIANYLEENFEQE